MSSVSSVMRPDMLRANSRLPDGPVSRSRESDNSLTRLPMASAASFLALANGCDTERICSTSSFTRSVIFSPNSSLVNEAASDQFRSASVASLNREASVSLKSRLVAARRSL